MSSPTNNAILDSILGGTYGRQVWGSSPHLTFYFANNYATWTDAEKTSFRKALHAWAAVADVHFHHASNRASANLVEHSVSASQMADLGASGALGLHETPHNSGGKVRGWYDWQHYGYAAHSGKEYDAAALKVGGSGYATFLHEIGHALGLEHPHDRGDGSIKMPGVTSAFDSYGNHNLNQALFTVMSYNDGWDKVQDPNGHQLDSYGYSSGPGALDIAAAQYYYGANMHRHSGNNTYVIRDHGAWRSIWDVGGTDTIKYGGSGNAVINLNSATLDNTATGGGRPSYVHNGGGHAYFGGFTIAGDYTNALANRHGESGVIIENATGGSGNDKLVGNAVGNVLLGHGGSDVLKGGRGNDKMHAGGGSDTLIGGPGKDVLDGNGGHDRMTGGAGHDVFVFGPGDGHDRVVDFADNIDTLRLDSTLWGGGHTARWVVRHFATDTGSDILFDFGSGQTLLVAGIAHRAALIDDLHLV